MNIENKIITFDTNIWLSLINEDKRRNNYNTVINETYLSHLELNNYFGIFNISVIELLMRFKRENNISKIRKTLNYFYNHNIQLGQFEFSLFYNIDIDFKQLINLDDSALYAEIDRLTRKRFEVKSNFIALFILFLFDIGFSNFVNSNEERDQITIFYSKQLSSITNQLIEYFYYIESLHNKKNDNLNEIVNKIYIQYFNDFPNHFNHNESYLKIKSSILQLKPYESISTLYQGVYEAIIPNVYDKIINNVLNFIGNSKIIKAIFLERLKSFMQGEPLQRNDIEDMLMLSCLEIDNRIIIITKDKKMRSFLKNNNYYIGNMICDNLLLK